MKLMIVIASLLLLHLQSVHGQTCTEVPNCDSCENRGPECLECRSNQVLSDDRKRCLDCPTNCAECDQTENEVSCTKCAAGFLEDGACTDCDVADCKLCADGVATCTECEDDYSKSSAGDACTLSACPSGKYLDGDSCKGCGSNVESCTSTSVTRCVKEGVNYVKAADSKSCMACNGCTKCALVDGTAECTECAGNKHLNNGVCDSCTADCKTCDGSDCTECNTGYGLDSNNDCVACPVDCDTCSVKAVATEKVCDTCTEQYGLNGDVICEACPDKCATCAYDGGNLKCLTCTAPAVLGLNAVTGGYDICYDLPARCTELIKAVDTPAPVAGGGSPQCKACDTGYGLDGSNACITVDCETATTGAIANCKECTASDSNTVTGCTTCAAGFAKKAGTPDTCVSCRETTTGFIANCAECTLNTAGDTVTACTTCEVGFAKKAGAGGAADTCVSCTPETTGAVTNCAECTLNADGDTVTACTTCNAGYYRYHPTSGSDVCVNCTETPAEGKCMECSDTDTCTRCIDGYGIYATTGVCVECDLATNGRIANCKVCTTSAADTVTGCTTCNDGYDLFAGTPDVCVPCPKNCNECTASSASVAECDTGKCAAGSVLVSGACKDCPANCAACTADADGTITCMTCSAGYRLDGGSCVACALANCGECDADVQKCNECSVGYADNAAECVDCPANCLECDYDAGVMVCSKCATTYALTDGTCAKCPTNCLECSSATKCPKGKCNTGYAVGDAGDCQDCASLTGILNCATCKEKADANSTATCTACISGYTLKDGVQSGADAACVSVSDLQCGGSGVVDRPFQCADEESCTDDTKLTADKLCGRLCYSCGNYTTNTYVSMDACKTDNETELSRCPSGFCVVKSLDDNGEKTVLGGCLPQTKTCESEDVDCKDAGGLEECEQCCEDNECSNDGLRKGLTKSNAPTTAASFSFFLLLAAIALITNM